MGGFNSSERYIQGRWESVSQNYKNYSVVRDSNGREGEDYTIDVNSKHNPEKEAEIYNLRKTIRAPVVHVYEWECKQSGSALQPLYIFRAITERITHRLAETPQLNFYECLYVLDTSLKGYQYLSDKVGIFAINQLMIGFTSEGEAKVWYNQNFGVNWPQYPKNTLYSSVNREQYFDNHYANEEGYLIRQIANTIEQKCEEGRYPQPFRSKIRQCSDFGNAQVVIQQTLRSSNIELPSRVDLFRNKISLRKVK